MNFIKRYWQGDYSLVISFWFIYVFLNLFISTFTLLIDTYYMNYNLIYLNMFIYIIISTWSLVGLWRSTIKYQIKKGAKIIPFLVKLLVVLSSVFYLYYILSGSYIIDSTKRIDVAKEFFEKGLK